MRQNINLIAGASVSTAPVVVRIVAALLVAVPLLALAVIIALNAQLAREETRLAELEATRDTLWIEVARIRAEGPELDPEAEAATLQELEQRLAAQRAFLNELEPHAARRFQGFAAVLTGLARAPVEGLWLRELHVRPDGRMTLRGSAIDPLLVPRFVEGLRAQSVFRGRDFSALRLERQVYGVDFELDGRRVER